MSKKYAFTEETMPLAGRILHRIKALKSFNDVTAGAKEYLACVEVVKIHFGKNGG